MSKHEEVAAAADRIEDELGEITVWVNDAMTTVFSPFAGISPDEFQRAIEVTFLGQVWGTMVALERMRPRDRGAIVNVGSALAFIGIPLQSPYCASKFACRGFFESVRAELLHDKSNVRLSMVHMPALNTPQFDWCMTKTSHRAMPVPPIYQPEVGARFIVETALDGRRAKIVGSWNKLLVFAAERAPALANQYAAIGAWDAQLTSNRAGPGDPVNLWEPVDREPRLPGPGPLRRASRRVFRPVVPPHTADHGDEVPDRAARNRRGEAGTATSAERIPFAHRLAVKRSMGPPNETPG